MYFDTLFKLLYISGALVSALPKADVPAVGPLTPVRRDGTPTSTNSAPGGDVSVLSRRQTYGCDVQWMRDIEAQAWSDAGALAAIAKEWDGGKNWDEAMTLFMGRDANSSSYKKTIQNGLNNEDQIHHPNKIFPEGVVSVYCGDNQEIPGIVKGTICKKQKRGKTVYPFASSWVDRGRFYNDYHMVLCPRFFAEKDSLFHTLAKMNLGQIKKDNATAYKYTWGHTYFHELLHLDPVVGPIDIGDSNYGACDCAKLAQKEGAAGATKNAESWSFFADTAYFQTLWNLTKPGQPDCSPWLLDVDDPDADMDIVQEGDRDRSGDSFSAQQRPPPGPNAKDPAADKPVPSIPFDPNQSQDGVAQPFPDAVKWFADNAGGSEPSDAKPSIGCDHHALSGVPYNVFSGGSSSTSVYTKFCSSVDVTKELKWTVDAKGEQKSAPSKRGRIPRTPPPNPNNYGTFSFELSWEPSPDKKCGSSPLSCADAFGRISDSPCGQQGGEQNGMTAAGNITLAGCGVYSYKITGPDVPPPQPDLNSDVCKQCDSNLVARDCGLMYKKCLVDQCKADKSCQDCGLDCDQYNNL